MLNPSVEALPRMSGLKFSPLVPITEAELAGELGKIYTAISKLPRSISLHLNPAAENTSHLC